MRRGILASLALADSPTIRTAYAAFGNRGPGFDTVRLVAACAVVLHHSLKLQMDIVRDDVLFHFSHGYTQTGLLAVSVFFALSGFLVTPGLARNGNVIEYLSRRFMRIMPLLAFVVVVTALVVGPLVSALPPGEYYAQPQTWRYLQNVTTSLSLQLPGVTDYDGGDTINGPMWTLRYEWLCYFAIAAASVLAMFRHRSLFLLGWMGCLALLNFGLGSIPADQPRGMVYMQLYLFAYFGAGVVIYLFADWLRWSKGLLVGAVVALAACYQLGLGYLFGPFLTAYIVVGIGLLRFPWARWIENSDMSYGVYLIHSVVLVVLMTVHPFESGIVLFLVCLPLTCLAAMFTWHFIERPALRHKLLPAQILRGILLRLPVRLTGMRKVDHTP